MKINELKKEMLKKGIDYSLFFNLSYDRKDPNVAYFTQIEPIFCCLIVPKKGPAKLIVPGLEYLMAKRFSSVHCVVKLSKKKRLSEYLKLFFKKKRIKRAGINKEMLPLNAAKRVLKIKKGIRSVDISSICLKLREEKTEQEIRNIKKACSIGDAVIKKALKNFKFRTEAEMSAFLGYGAKKLGCDLAYPPIVASGKNSQYAHHNTGSSRIKKGFLLVDYGVKYKGYCSDMSRTFYVGKPSKKEIEDYKKVLKAQEDAITSISLGRKCSFVYKTAVKSLGGDSKYFTHALGHGLGVFIHETPSFNEKSTARIKKNMVFTIEPGVYRKNKYGIRIEDTILMKERPIRLTKTPKNLITLPKN